MSGEPQVQTYVIFDLESTGLPEQDPKITELCFLAVSRSDNDMLTEKSVPRVINKLLVVADPGKLIDPEAAYLTDLNNELLSDQKPFDKDMVQMMSVFLDRLPKPVCLLAHNGDGFDYPLLMSELQQAKSNLPGHLLCADTLAAFKELKKPQEKPNKKVSYKLETVYRRCFDEAPPVSHTAEDDCVTLLKIVKNFSPEFGKWCDKNAKKFEKISPMY